MDYTMMYLYPGGELFKQEKMITLIKGRMGVKPPTVLRTGKIAEMGRVREESQKRKPKKRR